MQDTREGFADNFRLQQSDKEPTEQVRETGQQYQIDQVPLADVVHGSFGRHRRTPWSLCEDPKAMKVLP